MIITSANALRATTALHDRLRALPLFAVGDHTAATAREAGFSDARSAHADVSSLIALVAKEGISPLLYLAGEDVSADLPAQLAKSGITVVAKTVYRMAPAHALPDGVGDALAHGGVDCGAALFAAVGQGFPRRGAGGQARSRRAGVAAGLHVGPGRAVLREAGAKQLAVAETPDEEALLEAIEGSRPKYDQV